MGDTQQFHWESQNKTAIESVIGQCYVNHVAQGTDVLTFIRLTRSNDFGASPYLCLGRATHVEHRGSRPIAVTWALDRKMPADAYMEAMVVAS